MACNTLIVHEFEINIDPFSLIFYSFLIATIYFTSINLTKLSLIWHISSAHISKILWINVTTAGTLLGMFWALTYIPPHIALAIFLIATSTIAWFPHANKTINIGLFLTACLLIVYTKTNNIGIFYAIIGGICGGFYIKQSNKMHILRLSATQLLSIRFYALLIISSFFATKNITTIISNYEKFIIISLTSTILPLFCIQHAIEKLGTKKASALTLFSPLLTYLLYTLRHPFTFSYAISLIFGSIGFIGYTQIFTREKKG